MSETKPKPAVVKNTIQQEIYLRLVEATANSGAFSLGELKSGSQAESIAKHLRGVSEIVASVWEEKK
jgi:hypothetical protein